MASGDAFRVVLSSAGTRHCVATRSLKVGEVVLLEAPLASTRSEVMEGLPTTEVEWMLVHALLSIGRGYQWAMDFCRTGPPLTAASESIADVLKYLARTHAVTAETCLLMHQVVSANAFGLETPLLNVEYGAAFVRSNCNPEPDTLPPPDPEPLTPQPYPSCTV